MGKHKDGNVMLAFGSKDIVGERSWNDRFNFKPRLFTHFTPSTLLKRFTKF
jgi:hypothetical protein